MPHVAFAAVVASGLLALVCIVLGHVYLDVCAALRRAVAERDAARRDARSATLEACANRAALSLAEQRACSVCRDAWSLPGDQRRRAPLHPS